MRTAAIAMLASGLLVLGAHAQGPNRSTPREPLLPKTTVGSELYRFYCANCHGLDATGRPASPAMRTPSTDLTRLALNHGGVFPREAVRDVIAHGTGRNSAHGRTDMPVWGTIFRGLDPSDTMVDIRIDSLVRYIEGLQMNAVGTVHSQ
jgi:mono/diheme cytochrome c family protein